MSTGSKGDAFEDEVFALFSKLLEMGRLPFKPECAQIFQKKPYYSKDRSDNIIVDIAIEASFPGADKWSYLTVIECKNYTHGVPVDDIEEFSAKLLQIAGHNVKGIVATSHAFQRGSINFARSKGIALARILPSKEVLWDLYRRPKEQWAGTHMARNNAEIEYALTEPNYSNSSIRTFACVHDHFTYSLNELLRLLHKEFLAQQGSELLVATPPGARVAGIDEVPFLTDDTIEQAANGLIVQTTPQALHIPMATNLDLVCELLQTSTEVSFDNASDLGTDRKGHCILGRIVSFPPKIMVSSQIKGDIERSRFALAHEIGHLVLGHLEYLNQESFSDMQYDSPDVVLAGGKWIERIEIQANKFAAFLLLPRSAFLKQFWTTIEALGINLRYSEFLYVDDQRCNRQVFYQVTGHLKRTFKVSRTAVEYRLKDIGLLVDKRKPST